MDGKFIRKLLLLSCCANVVLYIFIINKCEVLPSGLSRLPWIKSSASSSSSSFNCRTALQSKELLIETVSMEKSVSTFLTNETTNSSVGAKSQHTVKNKSSNIPSNYDKLSSKGAKSSELLYDYDPVFGLRHQARKLSPRDATELFQRRVPNMVYYVWCGKGRTFFYKHFVSVYSVWYQLEPDVIEIHYEFPPLEDKYNTWLSWLRFNIPSFSLHPLPSHVTGNKCGPSFGLGILADRGGLFLDNGVMLQSTTGNGKSLHDIFSSIRSFSFFQDGSLAWATATAGDTVIKRFLSRSDTQLTSQNMSRFFQCQSSWRDGPDTSLYNCAEHYNMERVLKPTSSFLLTSQIPKDNKNEIVCNVLPNSIHPIELRNLQNRHIGRILFYSFDNANQTQNKGNVNKMNVDSQIPNIVHYIWFGSKNMTLSMYLSFLSTAFIVKPDMILIHTDLKLYGYYWELAVKHKNVHLVYREAPRFIYNHKIIYTQHRSDIVRADILDKYGGIYLDWDALWLKSPNDALLKGTSSNYDVILSRDHMPRKPFPETINMGVVLAKPRSQFIRALRAAWVRYRSNDFLYNAVELPYKIYELYSGSSLLQDRLQVMCYFLKCHPLFHPDHKHWGRSQSFNWTRDVYSIHFTHPDPPAFDNETALLVSGQGMFADMGRFIWEKSGQRILR